MALEAHVQGRFPFAGKMRNPGDVIDAVDLAKATPQMRDALVGQKLIVLQMEGAPADPDQRYQHLAALVDRQAEVLAALQAAQNVPSPELIAAIREVAQRAVQDAINSADEAGGEEAIEGAPPARRGRRAAREA